MPAAGHTAICAILAALGFAATGASSPFQDLRQHATVQAAVSALSRIKSVDEAALASLGVSANDTPQQLHLSLGPNPGAMTVTWVSRRLPANASLPSVTWWPDGAPGNTSSAAANVTTYSAGVFGWRGWIFTAVMRPLQAGVAYAYTVTGGPASPPSSPRRFAQPPSVGPASALRVAVTADMGTIVPLGWAVADQLILDHTYAPYDAVLMAGG